MLFSDAKLIKKRRIEKKTIHFILLFARFALPLSSK